MLWHVLTLRHNCRTPSARHHENSLKAGEFKWGIRRKQGPVWWGQRGTSSIGNSGGHDNCFQDQKYPLGPHYSGPHFRLIPYLNSPASRLFSCCLAGVYHDYDDCCFGFLKTNRKENIKLLEFFRVLTGLDTFWLVWTRFDRFWQVSTGFD